MYAQLDSFLIILSLTQFPDRRNGPSSRVLHDRRQPANRIKPSFSVPPHHLQHPVCLSLAPPNHFPSRRPPRDGLLDSYYAKNQSAVAAPRSFPSPTILAATPQKRAATVDVDSFGGTNVSSSSGSGSTNKGLKIQTTPALTRSNTHTQVTSAAGERTLPVTHPTGPIKPRTTKPLMPVMSPTNTPVAMTSRSLPQLYISVSARPTRPVSPEKTKPLPPPAVDAAIKHKAPEETYCLESPLDSPSRRLRRRRLPPPPRTLPHQPNPNPRIPSRSIHRRPTPLCLFPEPLSYPVRPPRFTCGFR